MEVLRGLERQERRLEHARNERTPIEALTPYRAPERQPQQSLFPPRLRTRRPLGPIGLYFLRPNRARRLARQGRWWLSEFIRPGLHLNALARDPERAARRVTFRLATGLAPKPIREALWALRGLRGLGLRQR